MNLASIGMATSKGISVPDNFGDAFEGGYYAGQVEKSDGIYAVIIAPKASGQSSSSLAYNNDNTGAFGDSLVEGVSNNATIGTQSKFPASYYCANLSIDGFDDWYLPARDELEVCYRNLKPTTSSNHTGNRFTSSYTYTPYNDLPADTSGINRYSILAGSAYTSSVPSQTTSTNFITGGSEAFDLDTYYFVSTRFSSAAVWCIGFIDGVTDAVAIASTRKVRAIRSVKIAEL